MSKYLIRIFTLFLVSCIILEPSFAAGLSAQLHRADNQFSSAVFNEQAVTPYLFSQPVISRRESHSEASFGRQLELNTSLSTLVKTSRQSSKSILRWFNNHFTFLFGSRADRPFPMGLEYLDDSPDQRRYLNEANLVVADSVWKILEAPIMPDISPQLRPLFTAILGEKSGIQVELGLWGTRLFIDVVHKSTSYEIYVSGRSTHGSLKMIEPRKSVDPTEFVTHVIPALLDDLGPLLSRLEDHDTAALYASLGIIERRTPLLEST